MMTINFFCGDFDVDLSRDSVNTKVLIDFMDSENLCSTNQVFNNEFFTYESINGARSNLDHIMFSNNCLDDVFDFDILINGSNLSDHNPVALSYSHVNTQ